MGTGSSSGKSFKGPGHVLGNAAPGGGAEKPAVASAQSGAPAKPVKAAAPPALKSKAASRAAPLTPAEQEERRKKNADAAAARERAWEARLAKSRANRPVEESLPINTKSSGPLSGPRGPIAGGEQIAANLEADAKKLSDMEKQGFNPYQARIESSAAARSAIVLEQGANKDDVDTMTRARSELVAAMHASTVDSARLRAALDVANKFEVPEVEEAADLLAAMDLGAETAEEPQHDGLDGVDLAWALLVQSGESKEVLAGVVRTLEKLCSNLAEHPEEARFRTIRLENKTISSTLVQPAEGGGVNVLIAVGFVRQGGDQLTVPDPATVPPEVVAVARSRIERVLALCAQWSKDNV